MPRQKKKNHPHYFQRKASLQPSDTHSNPVAGPSKSEIFDDQPDSDSDPVPGPSSSTESVPYVAPSQSQQAAKFKSESVAAPPSESNDAVEEPVSARLRSAKNKSNEEKYGCHRIVHLNKQFEMFNNAIMEHHKQSKKCIPQFELYHEKKVGFVVAHQLKCKKCDFVSHEPTKLYETVEKSPGQRGPACATLNLSLCSALLYTAIGPSKMAMLLNALDIPRLCHSSMQHLCKKSSDIIENLNQEDMKKLLIEDAGPSGVVDVSTDTVYNAHGFRVDRRSTKNAATVATTSTIEQNSGEHHIVAIYTQTKDCYKCSLMRQKDPTCNPIGHKGCTANTYFLEHLSEYTGGKECARQIVSTGVDINTVVTDGDSMCFKGFLEETRQENPDTDCHRVADVVHFHQTQLHQSIENCKFNKELFSVSTQKEQLELSKTLHTDIKCRSSMELKYLYQKHEKNIEKIKADIPKVIKSIIACYRGDCSQCRSGSSGTCDGDSKSWWAKSRILAPKKIDILHFNNQADTKILTEALQRYLGQEAVDKTLGLRTTQLNEAFNRCLNAILPKNQKFSRVLKGKIAYAVLVWNRKPKRASEMIAQALGIKTSKAQKTFYNALDRNRRKDILRNKSGGLKDRRRNLQAGYIRSLKAERQKAAKQEKILHKYHKNILDITDNGVNEGDDKPKPDHTYPYCLRRK